MFTLENNDGEQMDAYTQSNKEKVVILKSIKYMSKISTTLIQTRAIYMFIHWQVFQHLKP